MDIIKMHKSQIVKKFAKLKLNLIYTKLHNAVYFFRHKEFNKIWACIDK